MVSHRSARRPPLLGVAGGVLLAVLAAGCGGSSSSAPSAPSGTYVLSPAELSEILSEKVMGSAAAGITLVEYSSLTCPHCATFQLSTLPAIKAAYVDTGKVKVVYRDFPVYGAAPTLNAAYQAAALARCAGNARYFEALDLLYRGFSSWVSSSNPVPAMKQVLAPIGMAPDKMDACAASGEIRSEIDRVAAQARASDGINATPTVVINGQKLVGPTYAEIDAAIRSALGQQQAVSFSVPSVPLW